MGGEAMPKNLWARWRIVRQTRSCAPSPILEPAVKRGAQTRLVFVSGIRSWWKRRCWWVVRCGKASSSGRAGRGEVGGVCIWADVKFG